VRFLRFFADLFFRERYIHRAVVLETVAGVSEPNHSIIMSDQRISQVPGMIAGMLRHLSSLRKMVTL
jgi:ubiquinol oxidase